MDISAEKTKLMTNSSSGIQRWIKASRRFSQGLHKPPPALAELKPIWIGNNISLRSTPMPLVVGIYKQNILLRLFS